HRGRRLDGDPDTDGRGARPRLVQRDARTRRRVRAARLVRGVRGARPVRLPAVRSGQRQPQPGAVADAERPDQRQLAAARAGVRRRSSAVTVPTPVCAVKTGATRRFSPHNGMSHRPSAIAPTKATYATRSTTPARRSRRRRGTASASTATSAATMARNGPWSTAASVIDSGRTTAAAPRVIVALYA